MRRKRADVFRGRGVGGTSVACVDPLRCCLNVERPLKLEKKSPTEQLMTELRLETADYGTEGQAGPVDCSARFWKKNGASVWAGDGANPTRLGSSTNPRS